MEVVVAYDGSPGSIAALTWAAMEAGSRRARLLVLHATDVELSELSGAAGLAAAVHQEGVRLAEEGAARAVAVDGGPPREDVQVQAPAERPVRALVEASRGADLLVMGSRGRGSVAGALLGSVAFSVTAQAGCPVVVVRGQDGRRAGPARAVVIGVDGSKDASAALTFAADAAMSAGAALVVLAAWEPPEIATRTAYGASLSADLRRWAQDGAQRAADAALAVVGQRWPDTGVEARVLRKRPAAALVAASAEAGLVVVGTRGRGRAGGLFFGSVSHATVHGALCPVAVVHQGSAPR